MIGRFSQLGVYHELVRSRNAYRVAFAGALALASYLWDRGTGSLSTVGVALALGSVALNGTPIIWGAIRGLVERRVNVDELVSLAIVAALLEGEFLTAAVVSFVMVLGALIEQATGDSARKAIQSLITLSPETATVLVNGRPERVSTADVVLFDKTGTLTQGKPRVEAIVAVDGIDEKTVLEQAASVEQNSTHPLAQAVLKAANYAKITIGRAESIITEIGLGVRGFVGGSLVEVGSAYLGGGTANLPEGLRLHLERFKENGATPLIVYQD